MISILSKIFKNKDKKNLYEKDFEDLIKKTNIKKIFDIISNFSEISEIRYVGGSIRKIINNEKVDDIDLATNIIPEKVCEILKKNKINFYESGINHGTVTARIEQHKFEITTLRKDVSTDGRFAKVEFSNDWYEDASRRDFTFNAIYADLNGNLYDPFNGKKDLEFGKVNFIGDPEKRIKEDYLRILRYVRFFLNYSKKDHDENLKKIIKRNINGISKISSDRLIDELKKLLLTSGFLKLTKDKFCQEIISLIFPQLINTSIFQNINDHSKKIIDQKDFIFLISLMIIDSTDNSEYFIYKYNISNKDKKRIKFVDNFYKDKINSKKFFENNLNKVFYYNGKQAVIDILNFRIFKSQKIDLKLIELKDHFISKITPVMPIKADLLISKFKIPEGKILGDKIKIIEEKWVNNNFSISNEEVESIAKD